MRRSLCVLLDCGRDGRHSALGVECKRVELQVKSVHENLSDQHTFNVCCMKGTVLSARGATREQQDPVPENAQNSVRSPT